MHEGSHDKFDFGFLPPLVVVVVIVVVVIGEHRLDVARFIDISSDQLKGLVAMTGGS